MLDLSALPAEVQNLCAEMAADADFRQLAQPERIATTENSYGAYMGRLAQLPTIPGTSREGSVMLWGLMLIEAGGNEAGIRAAVKLSI